MANYYTHFNFIIAVPETKKETLESFLIGHVIENDELLDDPDYVDCEIECSDNKIWIYSDGPGNYDNAARITQETLRHYNLPPMGFEWANTCSKPHTNAFGGGAVWITHDNIEYMTTNLWLDQKYAQMRLPNPSQ